MAPLDGLCRSMKYHVPYFLDKKMRTLFTPFIPSAASVGLTIEIY
jgi:hypothetical protein